MYVPTHNQVKDRAQQLAFMREYNFAVLVTSLPDAAPLATHLPVVVEDQPDRIRLVAHLARANPQSKAIEMLAGSGREALVIFSGPHAYVSPTWYEKHPSVPTWNYQAIHVYGSLRVSSLDDEKMSALRSLTALHDAAALDRIADLPKDYLALKLKGILAFEVQVTRIEARFKLSQDRSTSEQAHIASQLASSPRPADTALAAVMQQQALA